jgi:hypothetical protein
MYEAVLNFLDAKPAMWNSIAPLAKSVFMFRTYVGALHQQSYFQHTQVPAVYAQDKDGQMRIMCDMALALLLKLRTYAKASNNKALLYAINYSDKELLSGSVLHIIKRCQTIYNKAKEHITELGRYELTQENLVQLQSAIDTVRPQITHRNAVASKKIAAMVNVPLLIEEARAELDKLDHLVKTTIFDKSYIKNYLQVRSHTNAALNAESTNNSKLQLI